MPLSENKALKVSIYMYIYIYQNISNTGKLIQQLFNLSEEIYRYIVYFASMYFCKFGVHTASFMMILLFC